MDVQRIMVQAEGLQLDIYVVRGESLTLLRFGAPTFFENFLKGRRVEDPSAECPICLTGGGVMCRLECGHIFHEKCLLKWFEQKANCPLCRAPVRAQ